MENQLIPGAESRTAVRSYVTANPPNPSALAEGLWVLPPDVLSSGDRAVLFDQYKLYVAEAERLSVRRTITSAFFLILNIGVLVAGTALLANAPERPWLFTVALIAALGLCLGWFWIIRSYRQMASGKYAVISHLDEQLGRIFAALKSTGQAENTLILFTSDHGLAIGSHGLRGKQNMYEHTVAVPLVLAGPGVPEGARRDAPVYLSQLYPTSCELVGVKVPATVEAQRPATRKRRSGVPPAKAASPAVAATPTKRRSPARPRTPRSVSVSR